MGWAMPAATWKDYSQKLLHTISHLPSQQKQLISRPHRQRQLNKHHFATCHPVQLCTVLMPEDIVGLLKAFPIFGRQKMRSHQLNQKIKNNPNSPVL